MIESNTAIGKQVDSILEVVEDYTKEELAQAGQRLRNIVLNENPDLDKNQTLDVAVSFDGTWAKRGFTSLTGVVFAISVDSGDVLDYTVLSKACQKCSLKQSQCEGDDEQFPEWRREHLASGDCDLNFNGSSPAMEAEELLFSGGDQLNCTTRVTNGWSKMETAKHSALLKRCMMNAK